MNKWVILLLSTTISNVAFCEGQRTYSRRDGYDDPLKKARTQSSSSGERPRSFFYSSNNNERMNFRNPEFPFNFGNMGDFRKNVYALIDSGTAGKAGYGFGLGYCSGYCAKKVAKAGAFVIGGAFILIQTLAYQGYIRVNQDQIKFDAEGLLDVNKDGKVDSSDFDHALNKMHRTLEYNLPSGGGFTVGLLAGLR